MGEQIRGFIVEGLSCSGKTSLIEAVRRLHPQQKDAERNTIFLGEYYSQSLNFVHGELRLLPEEENLRILRERLSMLEDLSGYADSMGDHSRRSRGLFFVFERFHLNCAYARPGKNENCLLTADYRELENRLISLNAHLVLCTISFENVEKRLSHRARYTGEKITEAVVENYLQNQKRMIRLAKSSRLPCTILDTSGMKWDSYAGELFSRLEETA